MLDEDVRKLQDELQALKAARGSKVRLLKSKGEDAPFPITIKADIIAPPTASMYDISGFQVILKLDKSSGKEVCIESAELPSAVKRDMASALQNHSVTFSSGRSLDQVLQYAESHFQELITSRPDLVESYESVDSNGASVRRYMLIDPQSHIEAAPEALGRLKASNTRPAENIEKTAVTARHPTENVKTKDVHHPLLVSNERVAMEVAYMQRRFRSALIVASTSDSVAGDELEFELSFVPTDPSWQQGRQLTFKGVLRENFPASGSVNVTVKPASSLNQKTCSVLDKILASEIESIVSRSGSTPAGPRRSYILGDLIRSWENNAAEFLHLAEDVVAQKHKTEKSRLNGGTAQGATADVSLEGLSIDEVSQDDSASDSAHTLIEGDWSSEESSLSEEDSSVAKHERNTSKLEGMIIALQLKDLKLDNIDAVDPLMLSIQIMCTRCQSLQECQLATDAVQADSLASSGACSKCNLQWSLEFRPLLAHAYSSSIAHLRPSNCQAMDLTPSLFACQCATCSSIATFKDVQIARTKERNCSSCHSAMSLAYSAVQFLEKSQQRQQQQQQTIIGSSLTSDARQREDRTQSQLIPGTALPAKGTCKHYPHSYRWLRFPCCGKRFPCDLCHEEESDGHHMKWAYRHVCGFCSTEQKIDDRCCNCNKPLAFNSKGALGSQTRHWEGGQGCRDKKRLDRRDRAKYRGTKAKSVSKKAFRVGEEGARRRKPSSS